MGPAGLFLDRSTFKAYYGPLLELDPRWPWMIFLVNSTLKTECVSLSANPETFQPGSVIIRQGEELKTIFVILDGEVVVEQLNPNETETMELARLGVGNVFGEMSFLTGERTSATVRTMTEVDVLCLPHRHLRNFPRPRPNLRRTILQIVGCHARRSIEGCEPTALRRHPGLIRPRLDSVVGRQPDRAIADNGPE